MSRLTATDFGSKCNGKRAASTWQQRTHSNGLAAGNRQQKKRVAFDAPYFAGLETSRALLPSRTIYQAG